MTSWHVTSWHMTSWHRMERQKASHRARSTATQQASAGLGGGGWNDRCDLPSPSALTTSPHTALTHAHIQTHRPHIKTCHPHIKTCQAPPPPRTHMPPFTHTCRPSFTHAALHSSLTAHARTFPAAWAWQAVPPATRQLLLRKPAATSWSRRGSWPSSRWGP